MAQDTCSAVWLLHGWRQVKLMPSWRTFSVHRKIMHLLSFIGRGIRKVHVCLAVTCHLHFRQNDRDLLRDTAVTRGWNGYRNESQHRKLAMENNTLSPLLPGLKRQPSTFRLRGRRSTTELSPLPITIFVCNPHTLFIKAAPTES